MIYDGLGYFLVLTGGICTPSSPSCTEHPPGVNVFNLILYRASDESVQVRVSLFPVKQHTHSYRNTAGISLQGKSQYSL